MIITIFTPTYNRAEYLLKLYESLVNQTSKEFEWVIVDDGSSDNTYDVVTNFIEENKILIKYFKQENSGKHIAINKGVELAQGELFFIVDSDDYLLPNAVAFVSDKYEEIKDVPYIGGLSARRGYGINQPIGSNNFSSSMITDVFEFRYKHNIMGDMAEVVKTSVLKKFPFPKINDERFCPESLIWNRIGVQYKFLWLPDIIYIGEYLQGGLTDNNFKIRKKSPESTLLFYKELQEMPVPFVQKLRANINYWRFAKFSKTKFSNKWSNTNALLSLLGLPLSLIFLMKDTKMKILQIIDSLGTGGAEKLILETVPLMSDAGHEVDVLLLNGEKTPFYEQLESTNSCSIFSLGKSFYNPFYIFKIIPFLFKYDVVHVHLFPAQYFAVLAKILSFSKVKLVFTEHNTENTRLNNSKFRWIEKFIYKYYQKIICITPEVKKVLKAKLDIDDNKLIVIQNGINTSNIKISTAADRKKIGFSDHDKLLIMVAGFRAQKDQDTLIKTLKELPEEYKLLLVGDGERRSILENLIKELNIKDRVTLLGVRSDVYSLLKMSDIAVLSSHWEGFGLAAAEAMACGIPVLASNVEGLAQVVENGGILFEKGNVEDLKTNILKLNDTLYYKEIVKSGIEKSQQYEIQTMVEKLLCLYTETKHTI